MDAGTIAAAVVLDAGGGGDGSGAGTVAAPTGAIGPASATGRCGGAVATAWTTGGGIAADDVDDVKSAARRSAGIV